MLFWTTLQKQNRKSRLYRDSKEIPENMVVIVFIVTRWATTNFSACGACHEDSKTRRKH